MLTVVDGDNFYRRRIEADPSGLVLRNLILDVENAVLPPIWCWDGYGGLKRRREIYPAYKTRRGPVAENIYKTREVFQTALLHTKAIQIRVPEYEADDVIASIVTKYATEDDIRVLSNDKDLLQLETLGNVKIDREPIGIHASEIRLWKTLVGDPSDSISGVKGFGKQAWERCNKDEFRALFEHKLRLNGAAGNLMEQFNIPGRCAVWMLENEAELHAMWNIIGLYQVPWGTVTENMIVGRSDPAKVDVILREFLL
jgi:hypothetical protein